MVERKHGKTKRLARKFQLSAPALLHIYIVCFFYIYTYIFFPRLFILL